MRDTVYSYQDLNGREKFQRVRFEGPEGKVVVYRFQCDPRTRCEECDGYDAWHWEKPPAANGYLYRWPDLTLRADTLYIVEGEKDADAMAAAGVVVTTHHQGAEVGPSQLQVRHVVETEPRRVVIVADRDEAGAFCAWTWHELLRTTTASGGWLKGDGELMPSQITIVHARGMLSKVKDASDHLEAGYGPDEFVVVDKAEVRRVAMTHRSRRRRRRPSRGSAYRPGKRWGGA